MRYSTGFAICMHSGFQYPGNFLTDQNKHYTCQVLPPDKHMAFPASYADSLSIFAEPPPDTVHSSFPTRKPSVADHDWIKTDCSRLSLPVRSIWIKSSSIPEAASYGCPIYRNGCLPPVLLRYVRTGKPCSVRCHLHLHIFLPLPASLRMPRPL